MPINVFSSKASSERHKSDLASSSLSRQKCCHISLDEIKDATDNFDERNVLGRGGEGKVYLAEIRLGCEMTQVAVKHLKPNSEEEFEKEIKTVSKIQHPNLVSLLGYCDDSGQKILVYEFMENGSLSSYVKEKSSTISLSWEQRLRICLGAARGLQHLHAETDEFPKGIIHRDVKPDNILLDKNWVAKISDFGMFKLSHVGEIQSTMITNLKGTGGYYAPEYIAYRSITRKIDVYAFGVVLFQVLCLKMPWDRGDESYYSTDDEDLGIWAQQNVDTKIKEEIVDDSLKAFTAIVGKSLKKDPRKRPTMDGVVLDLENALKCQKHEDEAMQLPAATESDQKSTRFRLKAPSMEKLLVDFNLPAKHLSEEARDRAQRNRRKATFLIKKNKKSAQSKNQKAAGTDTNGFEGEETNNNSGGKGQSSSSYSCSEDDSDSDSNSNSNASQESNAGALNLNGKTRASRGAATDPQSLYAMKRRERIKERLIILQNLVPNGTKVDITTMLEEAFHYVKFLQLQIKLLSSDDMWMYAPTSYNGMDMGLYQKISSTR